MRMAKINEGDKSTTLCETCEEWVDATILPREMAFDEFRTVKRMLVDVCDKCGIVACIPMQSVTKELNARKKRHVAA